MGNFAERQTFESISLTRDEEEIPSVKITLEPESFLPRIVSLLHILRQIKNSQNPDIYNFVADQVCFGTTIHPTIVLRNSNPNEHSRGFFGFINILNGEYNALMRQYAGAYEQVDFSTFSSSQTAAVSDLFGPYRQGIGLITAFIINLEKSICYDVASLASYYKAAPAPGGEDSNTKYWQRCFGGGAEDGFGDTFPIGKEYSGGSDNANLQVKTSYRGFNHYTIRRILLRICMNLAEEILSGTFVQFSFSQLSEPSYALRPVVTRSDKETIRARVAKLLLTKVDGMDSKKGPTRFMITRGDFPLEGDEPSLSQTAYNKILPNYIRASLEAGQFVQPEITAAELANDPNKIQDFADNFNQRFGFLLDKVNFVPATYVVNSEIPKAYSTNSFQANRGPFSKFIDSCIHNQEGVRRSYEYIDNVKEKFQNIKSQLKGIKDNPRSEFLKSIAKLPAIEIADIVKYAGERQSNLRKIISNQQSGLKYNHYLPRTKYISENYYNNLKSLITECTNAASVPIGATSTTVAGYPNEGRIFAVGIPYGMLSSNATLVNESISKPEYRKLVILNQRTSLLYNQIPTKTKKRYYWPNLFIDNLEFAKLRRAVTLDEAILEINYTVINEKGNLEVMDYNKVFAELSKISNESQYISNDDIYEIPYNHLKDFLFKEYTRLYSGIDIDESNFSVVSKSNVLYLDQIAIDKFDSWAANLGLTKEQILSDRDILSFKDFSKNMDSFANEDTKYTTYSNSVSLMQSRLLSKEQSATKIFVPNIFDRIFCYYDHLAQHMFNPSALSASPGIQGRFIEIDNPTGSGKRYVLRFGNAQYDRNIIENDYCTTMILEVSTL